jgi:exodeoxyribonuclease VII small subunit
MASEPNHVAEDNLPFERAVSRLEEIVRRLEDGELSLDASLAAYEQGVKYLQHCHTLLRAAERKVSLFTEFREDGTAVLERFDEETMTLQEKQESRGRRRSQPPPRSSDVDVDTPRGLF